MHVEKMYTIKTESGMWTVVAPPYLYEGDLGTFTSLVAAKERGLKTLALMASNEGESPTSLQIAESVLVPTVEAWGEITKLSPALRRRGGNPNE